MSVEFWSGLTAVGTVSATLIIAWYAWETRRLRAIAQDQLEAGLAPMLLLQVEGPPTSALLGHIDIAGERTPALKFTIVNHGKGVALRANLSLSISPHDVPVHVEEELPPLPPDRAITFRCPAANIIGPGEASKPPHEWPEVGYVLVYGSASGRSYRTRVRSRGSKFIERSVEYVEVVPVTEWQRRLRRARRVLRRLTGGEFKSWEAKQE